MKFGQFPTYLLNNIRELFIFKILQLESTDTRITCPNERTSDRHIK